MKKKDYNFGQIIPTLVLKYHKRINSFTIEVLLSSLGNAKSHYTRAQQQQQQQLRCGAAWSTKQWPSIAVTK